jgi:cytochrome b561
MKIGTVTSNRPTRSEPVQRFSRLQIAAHWMSALAMLILFAAMWAREYIEEYALRVNLFELHRQMGLAILTLFAVRLLAKKFCPKKKPSGPQMGKLEHFAAACSHLALYIMLFAMPVIGWIITNAHGHEVRFLRMFTLPALVGRNEDLEDTLQLVHEYGAYALMGLIGLHFAAGLFHHFVKKDHVLASMIPLIGETATNERPRGLTHNRHALETMPASLDNAG